MKEHLSQAPSLDKATELAYKYFQEHKIEPFSEKELRRYIGTARDKFEKHLFSNIYSSLSKTTRHYMNSLLEESEEYDNQQLDAESSAEEDKISAQTEVKLRHLKKDIAGAVLKNIAFELKKIAVIKQMELPHDLLEKHTHSLIKKYYLRISIEQPSLILRRPEKDRYAMMALFLHYRSERLFDNLIDAFIQLIHAMRAKSENSVKKEIIKEVKHVNGKFDILYKLANIASKYPAGIIQDKIYPTISKETLHELITDLDHCGKWYQGQVQLKIHSLYSHGSRAVLLTLLENFDFHTNLIESRQLLLALDFIREHQHLEEKYYPDTDKVPMEKTFSSSWYNLVVEQDKDQPDKIKINRLRYEVAVLEMLKKQLSCKQIWVKGAYRYRNPDQDLAKDFDEKREFYYDWLGLPIDAKTYVNLLKESTYKSLESFNNSIVTNKRVKLRKTKKGNRIKLTPYEKQDNPPTISRLHLAIQQRWSTINLIDILKESDLRIDFTKQLETIASRENLPRSALVKRLLLCLFGVGSNAGLKRVQAANSDVTYNDLLYIKKRFLHADNVRASIVEIVNAIREIRDPSIWGVASTGCACDSTQVASWDQNLLAQWHPRYKKRGVMIYWHVDNKSACIYSQLKTCTSSEVASMLNGFLNHKTKMNMNKTYVDTHGQSKVGFAISQLLGFELLPRLKNINKQKLYYPEKGDEERYPNLELILDGPINWQLIEDCYDEIVKHIVALKKGIVESDVLIKRFSKDNFNHPVYKALLEIGKAIKTQFLCRYLEEEELRIEINESLNVVERLNGIMDFIFYGKLGEISTNIKEDQELAVVCLHLLQVCMVYINTLIIQEILAEPEWQNALTSEDKRALTPIIHTHINPYGLFPLDLVQRLKFTAQENETMVNQQANAVQKQQESMATV
jgi:TnpA family transposase